MAEFLLKMGTNQSTTNLSLSDAETQQAIGYINTCMKENSRILVLSDEMLETISELETCTNGGTRAPGWLDDFKGVVEIFEEKVLPSIGKRYEFAHKAADICASTDTAQAYEHLISESEQPDKDLYASLKEKITGVPSDIRSAISNIASEYLPTIPGWGKSAIDVAQAYHTSQGGTSVIGSVDRIGSIYELAELNQDWDVQRSMYDSTQLCYCSIDPPPEGGDLIVQHSKPSPEPVTYEIGTAEEIGLPTPSPANAEENVEDFVNNDVDLFPLDWSRVSSTSISVLLGSICAMADDLVLRAAEIAQEAGVRLTITEDLVTYTPDMVDSFAIPAEYISDESIWQWTSGLGDLGDLTVTVYGTEFGIDQTLSYELIDGTYQLDIDLPSIEEKYFTDVDDGGDDGENGGGQQPSESGTYTGSFSGTGQFTKTSYCSECGTVSSTITYTVSGTLTATDVIVDAYGPVYGTIAVTGSSWSCTYSDYCGHLGPPNDDTQGTFTVPGNTIAGLDTSNIGFVLMDASFSLSGSFSGALSGSTISGTIEFTTPFGSFDVPVTLT